MEIDDKDIIIHILLQFKPISTHLLNEAFRAVLTLLQNELAKILDLSSVEWMVKPAICVALLKLERGLVSERTQMMNQLKATQ